MQMEFLSEIEIFISIAIIAVLLKTIERLIK
jgi:hypothetical protein